MTTREIAQAYIDTGWEVVRIPPLEKGLRHRGWAQQVFTRTDFAEGDNIGVKLGPASGGLIDIDLDCPEAIALAPYVLPVTLTFGRLGLTKTITTIPGLQTGFARHYLYRVPDMKTHKPPGIHVEIRGCKANGETGLQTVFPGSYHKDTGHPIQWTPGTTGPPTELTSTQMLRAFARLAVAVVTARSWTSLVGNKHDYLLAIAGALWHAGWTKAEATAAIIPATELDGSCEPHRTDCIDTTWDAGEPDKNRYGWPTVARLIPDSLATTLANLVKAGSESKPSKIITPTIIDDDGEEYDLNDSGNADRLIKEHGEDIRYIAGVGWHAWNGTVWAYSECGPFVQMEAVAKTIGRGADHLPPKEAKAVAEWARQSGNASRIVGAITVASNRTAVRIRPDDLDPDPWLFNAANGLIDLRTGAILPHERKYMTSRVSPVVYDPRATCPRFLQFLSECMGGDMELVGYLLRYMGYSLTADISEHVLAIWHGPQGGNGKSTLLNVLAHVLGDYAGVVAPQVLMQSGADAHPTGLMDLLGRRCVTANETPEGKRWNESLVKQLTGGDAVKARAMRKDFVEFKPTWKLILATNAKPVVREQGGSFWRRVHLVPWNVSFSGRPDHTLGGKLYNESAGILALLVQGCRAWQEHGLMPPKRITEAVDDYRKSQDLIGLFIRECLEPAPPDTILTINTLYATYKMWAQLGQEYCLSRTIFGRILTERNLPLTMSGGLHGYRIRTAR